MFVKKIIHFIKIQNIHAKQIFIFFKNPEYSFELFIHKNEENYSKFQNKAKI